MLFPQFPEANWTPQNKKPDDKKQAKVLWVHLIISSGCFFIRNSNSLVGTILKRRYEAFQACGKGTKPECEHFTDTFEKGTKIPV